MTNESANTKVKLLKVSKTSPQNVFIYSFADSDTTLESGGHKWGEYPLLSRNTGDDAAFPFGAAVNGKESRAGLDDESQRFTNELPDRIRDVRVAPVEKSREGRPGFRGMKETFTHPQTRAGSSPR